MSSELGVTSCLSRAIWSSGVVVVSPHPGQENPGQTTHDDGAVWVRPALVLNERIRAAPPTSYHKLVAAALSLSSIISSASDWSLADSPVLLALISLGQQRLEDVELDHARLGLRLALAEAPGLAGPYVVDGGQDGACPARQVRGRRGPERIPVARPGGSRRGRRSRFDLAGRRR